MIDAVYDLEDVTRRLKLPGGMPVAESRKLLERAATDFYDITVTPYEPSNAYAAMLTRTAVALSILSAQLQMISIDVRDEAFEASVEPGPCSASTRPH